MCVYHMVESQYIPRLVILLGLIIHATASYLLPWIGYEGVINLNLISIVGMGLILVGIALLFYYD